MPDDGPYWIWESHGRPERPGNHLLGIGIFPLTLLSLNSHKGLQAGTWLRLERLEPLRHKCRITTFVNDAYDERPDAVEQMSREIPAFHLEDMEICRETQRGMASTLATPPNLSHQQEAVIERFHAWITGQFAARARQG